jgi:integrase
MTDMPRPRPPHLHREVTRHGKGVWYVRVDKGPRIRLRAEFGTSDFDAEYQAAISDTAKPKVRGAPKVNSLAWLIARYRETTAWMTALSAATRRQRENIFRHVIETGGDTPYVRVDTAAIVAGRDRRAATPAQARNFLDAMRGLFRWAKEAQHVTTDPTEGVKNPKRKKGPGFRKWTEEDMAAYDRRWPLGTRERVWRDVIAYTGLRRGDLVRIGRQHVRNGVATLKTEKGFEVTVTLPILPILQTTLDAGPCGDMTFIVGAEGNPLTKESFGNAFRKACRAAGVPGSAHGIRKLAATRAAENGATEAELNAIFGWRGSTMARHYTREANTARLAIEAMHKLANAQRTSIPAPRRQVRAGKRKTT